VRREQTRQQRATRDGVVCRIAFAVVGCLGCGSSKPLPAELKFNEIVSNNAGVWVDEVGETDDYIELVNIAAEPLQLSRYSIENARGRHSLPDAVVAPAEVILLWADATPAQGPLHLDFKVSASGVNLRLLRDENVLVDSVQVPALAEHHAFVRIPDGTGDFSDCGWATPARLNGSRCGPPPPPELPIETTFAPYVWPEVWPPSPSPLSLNELALRPAQFIEVVNLSADAVALADYVMTVAPQPVGQPWPDMTAGTVLAWPVPEIAAGEHIAVPLSDGDVADVAATAAFEGVVSVFRRADASIVDRVDFMQWPEGAVLARVPDGTGVHRFCQQATSAAPNDACNPLSSRPVGDRVRYLRTPADHATLASARHKLGTDAVEFVIDMLSGDVVSLLNSGSWDLHYTFIRETIQGLPHLDRCDPAQAVQFQEGWWNFSEDEYFRVDGRRYLLGTLVHYAGSDLRTVEFASGDVISPEQMKHAFFTITKHVDDPKQWALRPLGEDQVAAMATISGQVPIVDSNAPFRNLTFQPLNNAVAFGTLRFVEANAIMTADLGPHDILVTDDVPNDIPLIAGLITEAFQTPLAHVNVLSRGRGTPNLALANAHTDARIAPLLGKLVRFEVTGAEFSVREASAEEAIAFWQSRTPVGARLVPRLDTTVRGVQDLAQKGFSDIPSLGGKAAQLAELGRVDLCSADSLPTPAFGIPLVHSIEHYQASGALALLAELEKDPEFFTNTTKRNAGLERVRGEILAYPVDKEFLNELTTTVQTNWPTIGIKLRSSSNTEDLAGFNGAGLYTSIGVKPDDAPSALADALRTVWSSLFDLRAFDERYSYNVDDSQVGMGVLIHQSYPSEGANGVAISRDALDPDRGDLYYLNAQVGEALVTNPAPGVTSDEIVYDPGRTPHVVYHGQSSLAGGKPILTDDEVAKIACSLSSIHSHFRPLIDPQEKNTWFAMDIEFKLIGSARQLIIKQARPYSFGIEPPAGWCDF